MTGADGLTTATPRWLSRIVDLAVWGSVVVVTTLVGLMVIGVAFSAFGDLCDEFFESPNNLGGWSIAAATIAVTATIGWGFLRRYLHWLALVFGLAVQAFIFWLYITPNGSC